jgi:Flp pilus assembly protein TadB
MNTALLATACGVGLGLGLALLAALALPARPTLADAIAAPHRAPARALPLPDTLIQRLGTPAVNTLHTMGLPRAATRADLRTLDRPENTHLAQQAGIALLALMTAPLYLTALAVLGIKIPPLPALFGTVLLTVAGFLLPTRLARAEAAKLREQIRYATSALLDLVAVMLAAGAGHEEAFAQAADAGTGPGHQQLRAALGAAATTRTPLWNAFADLGERTAVRELTELAAAASLAGSEGAKIRTSLTTKAATLRARLLAAAETRAASATERMGLPTVLLMTGFMIFTCYPALAAVMHSL